MILLIQKWTKNFLLKRKSNPQTTACIRERDFIMGRVAGTIFQLSSRLPRLLSLFPEDSEFFLSVLITHGEILCFRLSSCLVAFEIFLFGLEF